MRAAISLSPDAEWRQFWIPNTDTTGASVPALNKKPVERTLERICLHCFLTNLFIGGRVYPHGCFPKLQYTEMWAEAGCELCLSSKTIRAVNTNINKAILGSGPASVAFCPMGSVGKVIPQGKNHNWIPAFIFRGWGGCLHFISVKFAISKDWEKNLFPLC